MVNYIVKVLIAGNGGVGKTTFINAVINDNFNSETRLTIGIDFHVKELDIDGKKIALQIWDLGGQERFKSLHENCRAVMMGAKGIVLMFDLTRVTSLENIEFWVDLCRKENNHVPILFVGSKLDLKDKICVEEDFIMRIKEKYNFFDYLTISSKTKYQIEKVLDLLVREMCEKKLI